MNIVKSDFSWQKIYHFQISSRNNKGTTTEHHPPLFLPTVTPQPTNFIHTSSHHSPCSGTTKLPQRNINGTWSAPWPHVHILRIFIFEMIFTFLTFCDNLFLLFHILFHYDLFQLFSIQIICIPVLFFIYINYIFDASIYKLFCHKMSLFFIAIIYIMYIIVSLCQ